MLPRAEMLIVDPGPLNAQKVAARVADMGAKNYLRIVGVIENMSEFVAPGGSRHSLFGAGGGRQLAADIGALLLGQVPIEPMVSEGGDIGEPAVLGEGAAADELRSIAKRIAEESPVEMAGCGARMLDAAVAALDAMDSAEGVALIDQESSSGGSSGRSYSTSPTSMTSPGPPKPGPHGRPARTTEPARARHPTATHRATRTGERLRRSR